MAGQTVIDRLTAAKHSIAGHGLAKSICKATTEEVMGPKKKHIDYLLQCTNEPNVSIPQMADLLIERTQNNNWVVVYKALITIHNLMNYGNERFTQYLASNNCTFNLGNFLDKSGVQAAAELTSAQRKSVPINSCYDMSTYIRRYAKYLNEKAFSYRSMAFDFCKVKRGKNDGTLRTMTGDKLLKALPVLQGQVDALLEFDCTSNELTNGVINACFMLMFKDLIRLFACYNDGIINLLEKYFDMNKKQCREALDLYKKFLVRMERVSEFLKVAESVGIDKGDIPDLARAPSSLLEALEAHLAQLEGNKKGDKKTKQPDSVSSAINTLAASTGGTVTEEEKKKILEEESKQLQKLKDEPDTPASTNPFAHALEENQEQAMVDGKLDENNPFSAVLNNGTASLASPSGGYDLLGAGSPTAAAPITGSLASDDLLSLSGPNPFTQTVMGAQTAAAPAPVTATDLFDSPVAAPMTGSSPWGAPAQPTGSPAVPTAQNINSGAFASEAQFAAVFGPSSTQNPGRGPQPMATLSFDALGEVMKPLATAQPIAMQQQQANQKLIQAGNLDGSLSSLASNLNINSHNISRTEHQWGPQGEKKLTRGGAGWNQPAPGQQPAMTTMAPQMGMTMMMQGPRSPTFPVGGMMNGMGAGMAPQMHAVNGGMNSWGTGMTGAPPAYGQSMGFQQQPMGMQAPMAGQQPGMFAQAGMQPQQMMNQPRPAQPGGAANDPFGAL